MEKIREKLIKEKEAIEKDLTVFKSEDPFLQPERTVFIGGEDSISEYEGHERLEATKQKLESRLDDIKLALKKIEDGKYGFCEKCGMRIQQNRLDAIPTARYCLEHQVN